MKKKVSYKVIDKTDKDGTIVITTEDDCTSDSICEKVKEFAGCKFLVFCVILGLCAVAVSAIFVTRNISNLCKFRILLCVCCIFGISAMTIFTAFLEERLAEKSLKTFALLKLKADFDTEKSDTEKICAVYEKIAAALGIYDMRKL